MTKVNVLLFRSKVSSVNKGSLTYRFIGTLRLLHKVFSILLSFEEI